jgi:signal recognition particle receptor subunit beta
MDINYDAKTAYGKIVYYGPPLGGKTQNLLSLFDELPAERRKSDKVQAVATGTDRTLFFDFLPFFLGKIGQFTITLGVYTVPGQVHYFALRQLVLKGAKAVIFVADSQPEMRQSNIDSLKELKEYLKAQNTPYEKMPIVWQFNKRDIEGIMTMEEMKADLGHNGEIVIPSIALTGDNVMNTLKEAARLMVMKARGVQKQPA